MNVFERRSKKVRDGKGFGIEREMSLRTGILRL